MEYGTLVLSLSTVFKIGQFVGDENRDWSTLFEHEALQ